MVMVPYCLELERREKGLSLTSPSHVKEKGGKFSVRRIQAHRPPAVVMFHGWRTVGGARATKRDNHKHKVQTRPEARGSLPFLDSWLFFSARGGREKRLAPLGLSAARLHGVTRRPQAKRGGWLFFAWLDHTPKGGTPSQCLCPGGRWIPSFFARASGRGPSS